jgi:hypothetical protein
MNQRPAMACGCLWLAACLPAQTATQEPAPVVAPADPAPEPFAQERAAWIARLDRAHLGGRERPEFDRFRANLRITSLAPDTDNVEIGVTAEFLAPNRIRTRIEETDGIHERGHDDRGPWQRDSRGVFALEGRTYAKDRQEVQRHLQLSRQLLEYLDPARALGRMEITAGAAARVLTIGQRLKIESRVLTGTVASFPLYDGTDGVAKVRLELWVDAATDLLVGVHATPLDAEGKALSEGEFVLLQAYAERDGVRLPGELTIYRVRGTKREAVVQARIAAIDLHPDLTRESIARPK